MDLTLDRILMGAPDLEAATGAFAALSGVAPAGGGPHPGFGTRNQLLSLGERLFFEIIAPDPAQANRGRRADGLEDFAAPGMLTFCVESERSDRCVGAGEGCGFLTSGTGLHEPYAGRRCQAGVGNPVSRRAGMGDSVPFVINWKSSPHPAETSPGGCTLLDFTVLHPKAVELRALYRALGIEVTVKAALSPGFVLCLDTPNGEVVLT